MKTILVMLSLLVCQQTYAQPLKIRADASPSILDLNDHVPADMRYMPIPAGYKSPAASLARFAIREMEKTLKADERLTFKAYFRSDRVGNPEGQVLIVAAGIMRPMTISPQSDCPINTQFRIEPLFALDVDDPHEQDAFEASEYGPCYGDGVVYVPQWLNPVAAYWTRQRHGWDDAAGRKVVRDYRVQTDGHTYEVIYKQRQVDQYNASVLQQADKVASNLP